MRKGLTLIEIMVVMAIIAIVLAVGMPAISGVLALQQQAAITELSKTYVWLIDEAAMRNTTFRVAYNLDRNTWKVEAGDPSTLVFSTPEEREKHDEEVADMMSRFTQRELEEGAAADIEDASGRFEGLDDPVFTTEQTLPDGIRFQFIYTPQYGEDGMMANPDGPSDDPEEDIMAYTYIFSDGTAEHTVIRIVDVDDEEDGYTLEIEPLSGVVRVSIDEVVDPDDSLSWLPDEGPSLQ
ncbi:MAG: prepilin-type N-terminal cleavage/methylation domain-containing protein [Myxococcota bacterium]|nr:prepilin-type N-terminal cleavage/methylation domain-containing protein [Myxococcota bacterium]